MNCICRMSAEWIYKFCFRKFPNFLDKLMSHLRPAFTVCRILRLSTLFMQCTLQQWSAGNVANNNSVNPCVLLGTPERLFYISCVYILVNILRPSFSSSRSTASEIVLLFAKFNSNLRKIFTRKLSYVFNSRDGRKRAASLSSLSCLFSNIRSGCWFAYYGRL